MALPTQLVLDLALRPRFEAENFLISASNQTANALIAAWPQWPSKNLMLVGPAGSGKSHLGAIWSRRARAQILSTRDLITADLTELGSHSALLIEDLHQLNLNIETALFHLINLTKITGTALLFTSSQEISNLDLQTADLRSRLREATFVKIGEPDEALIWAVIVKLFADRQLVVDAGVVDYISLHIERSLEAARSIVIQLDAEALTLGRRITRSMVSEVLKSIDELEA